MRYEYFLAHRFFRSRKRTGFVSLITWISIGGVALGVGILILALSIMNGLSTELTSRLLGTNAAIILLRHDDNFTAADSVAAIVRDVPGVEGVSPFVYGEGGLLQGARFKGFFVKGLRYEDVSGVNSIVEQVTPPLESLDGSPPPIVLGRDLAHAARVSVGDEVLLANPVFKVTIMGPIPRVAKFRVAGIWRSRLYEYDSSLAFVGLEQAQKFYRMGDKVTGIEVKVTDPLDVENMKEQILQRLGGYPYRINTWIDLNQNLFIYMQIEKYLLGLILLLIVLIAAFNIVGALTMMVMEKKREIGILKSMGATDGDVLRIFMTAGSEIGVIGIALGIILGLAGVFFVKHQGLEIPNDVYIVDTVPILLKWLDVVVVAVVCFFVCWLATLYPALKASRLNPLDAIRET
ncbi:MAG: ABC transporter permease [Candidatus Eisenbacteria bacterium]|uniref:ABC transporter permease n=1 Tax=Eiseniibacteriota bacterium TaxID=2212470 RepID=A0A7Y2H171_UNCEI|nr:ABC transporter permease [Candidatus Eisenbacteria bacterium]